MQSTIEPFCGLLCRELGEEESQTGLSAKQQKASGRIATMNSVRSLIADTGVPTFPVTALMRTIKTYFKRAPFYNVDQGLSAREIL